MELRDGVDFERKIFVKQQAAGYCGRIWKGEAWGGDRDWHGDRSLSAGGAALRDYAGNSRGAGATFRSEDWNCDQVEPGPRDREILRRVGRAQLDFVNLTVTTLDTELARNLEPRAPRPDLRLEAVRAVHWRASTRA